MKFTGILTMSLIGLICLNQLNAQTRTFVFERQLDVSQALSLSNRDSNEFGIFGDAKSGNIKVTMFNKPDYSQGNVSAGLIYGTELAHFNGESTMTNWVVDNEAPFYCGGFWGIPWFCGGTSYTIWSNQWYPKVIPRYAQRGAQLQEFVTWRASKLDVKIVVEFFNEALPVDIQKIKLPGVQTLQLNDFIEFNGDYSGLFNSNHDITVASHRGYWEEAGVVQNSINAIDAAANITGMDWIELDIRSTKDKHPILFHDDQPQKILRDISSTYPTSSVYDLTWNEIKNYYLYDRFNQQSSEKLLDLNGAFTHIANENITLPINMDIGIPAQVPQGSGKVNGQPFFDAVFLKAIGLAIEKNILDRIVFKGKYAYDDPIWRRVDSVLVHHSVRQGEKLISPKIAYTPKLGEEIPSLTTYFYDWMAVKDGVKSVPGISVEGIEIRLKNEPNGDSVKSFLLMAISTAQSHGLKVGVFSEAPSTCEGYWTKGAKERYINFDEEKRNNFEWLIGKGYDYIITDFPKNLIEFRDRNSGSTVPTSFPNYTPIANGLDKSSLENGFSVNFKANPANIKNKVLVELMGLDKTVYWRLGANSEGNLYVTRFVENGTEDYYWNTTFWEPEHTPFNHLTSEVYFNIVQESGQMRLHVATPDGKFDCMYSDYGLEDYVLNHIASNPDLNFVYNSAVMSHLTWQGNALCRTDAFKKAMDDYFDPDPTPEDAFSLLNHTNPFLNVSDFPNDSTTNKSDRDRLGGCTYYQDMLGFGSGGSSQNYETMALVNKKQEPDLTTYDIYPNPSSGIVNVQLESGFEEGLYEFSLFDLQGQLVSSKRIKSRGGETIEWDFNSKGEQLPNGVYLLKIIGMGRVYSQKLIIDCGCE
ncbi:glycerophosphodiester phosphodiesterase family protein [Roseivirga pacifica]|uniref:glycerophosphodiester phosphodiesterase family protein n=1 Tax=Roseivirga pacifica TaxID=1267423 RepID=UPI003BB01D9B